MQTKNSQESAPRITAGLRWAICAAGLAGGLVVWVAYRLPPPMISDFDHLYLGANALLAGREPYAAVVRAQPFPLVYPLTALLLVLPVAWLPLQFARALWSGLGVAALAAAAIRYRRGLPVALVSMALFNALALGQWSPLLVAGAVVPWAAVSWVAKPSIGLALFLAYPSRRAALLGLGLVALSLGIEPAWPIRWVEALRQQLYVAPVLRPGGVLLLLALLRYRRPEGRLLAALACIPQTTNLYETLPLFLLPQRRQGAYLLAALNAVAAFTIARCCSWYVGAPELLAANIARRWLVVGPLVWAPALLMVLRLRDEAPRASDPQSHGGPVGGAVDSEEGKADDDGPV